MSEPIWQLPACELQRRYRDGSLIPLAAAEARLGRLEAVNPCLKPVIARRDEFFLAAAATPIKDPRPKGRGIRRREDEPFSCSGEPDVGLAGASAWRRKRRGMRPEAIQTQFEKGSFVSSGFNADIFINR